MGAAALHPSDHRVTLPSDRLAAWPVQSPRRLPHPTAALPHPAAAASPSPAVLPLSLAGMDLRAKSSTAADLNSDMPPPSPVQQGPPGGADLRSLEEAATGVEQAALWHPSLPNSVQATIGGTATLNKPVAKASKADVPAPALRDLAADTVVPNSGGDGSKADASIVINIDQAKAEGVVTAPCNMFEDNGHQNICKGNSEITHADYYVGDDPDNTNREEFKEADINTIRIMIEEAVQNALIGAWESPSRSSRLKTLINDSVMKALKDSNVSRHSSNNPLPRADKMKLVKETLSEHQTFSRVLYVLALGTPITLLIARAVRGDKCSCEDTNMIRNTALEMGLSFLAVSVCHLYIIIFHFARTEGPKLSMCCMRLVIAFLSVLVSAWILVYTFHMPQDLFRTYFWWIIGFFLVINWVLSIIIGCTGILTEECMVDLD